MKQLLKNVTTKAKRVFTVENLNPQKGISSSMRASEDGKSYVVVLCLPGVTRKTVFHSYNIAADEMRKYRELYKQKKQEK